MNSRFPALHLPFQPPIEPAEARDGDELPSGAAGAWLYEPKWDGFRCVAFRDGRTVVLHARSGEPLTRYFPEVVMALSQLPAPRFVLDGELVVVSGDGVHYDQLSERIHPSARRVAQLAARAPATFVATDLLAEGDESLLEVPLAARRKRLERFLAAGGGGVHLTPATTKRTVAEKWLKNLEGAGLDGVLARQADRRYHVPARDGAVRVRPRHLADCVVCGVRRGESGAITTLLLGLHDDEGLLHFVGVTTGLPPALRTELDALVRPLVAPPGFTGRQPTADVRHGAARPRDFEPLRPALVAQVAYDRFAGDQFRHPPVFQKLRTDKAVRLCTLAQVRPRAKLVDKGLEVLGL